MATVLEIRFLGGRFHATPWGHHVNEAVLEWPPSPWRLLRALAAGLARAGAEPEACRATLEPLFVPPKYALPAASAAHTRHYMPWEKTRGKLERTLVLDAFVVTSDPLTAVWDTDLPDRAHLADALRFIPYVGRSQSWAELRLLSSPPPLNCCPLVGGEALADDQEVTRLLAPDPEQPEAAYRALFVTTDDIRGGGLERPVGTRWVPYARPRMILDPRPHRWVGSARLVSTPTVALYLVDSKAAPPLTEALRVGELLRRSAGAWYGRLHGGRSSPVLSGKDALGHPLDGHQHAFYFAIDEDDDRRIDRLVVYAPAGLSRAEQDALKAVRALDPGRGRPAIHLHLVAFGAPDQFGCRVFARARRWLSHTPFLLVRYPKIRGPAERRHVLNDPPRQVALELGRRGFPSPTSVRLARGAFFRWLEFRTRRHGDDGPPGAWGFEVEFLEPVQGPIAIGRLCHFGLGLFLPAD